MLVIRFLHRVNGFTVPKFLSHKYHTENLQRHEMTHLGGECVVFTVAGWMYIHPHHHPSICTYTCVWCNERELSCVLNSLCSLHVHTVHCSLSTYVHPVCIVTLTVLPCSRPHNVYICILSVYVPM